MGIFTQAELQRRMGAFVKELHERRIDAALLNTADNVFYMSGVPLLSEWGRPMWAVFSADGPSAVIGSLIEAGNMERNSATDEIVPYADEENVVKTSIKLATDFLRKGGRSPRTIGIERRLIPLGLYDELSAKFPDSKFVEIGD